MHEMLNEYQALWQTLKDVRDEKTQPVVLFNTMRNILEYYFSFACKTEKLKDALESLAGEYSDAGEYDSFYRAINRHSHSDGRNIFSTGVIDKDRYLKMFRRVFIQTDDDEHYLAMMGSLKDCQRRAFKQEASSPAGTVHLTRRERAHVITHMLYAPETKTSIPYNGYYFRFHGGSSCYSPATAGSPCNHLQAVKAQGNTRGDDTQL